MIINFLPVQSHPNAIGSGETMLSCNGIVKGLGKSPSGNPWMIRKNPAGIPFVTDGNTRKWCMSVYQEQAPAPANAPLALPNLEVTEDDIKPNKDSASMGAPRMPLAGVTPQIGTWG